ncbi:MAG TPA: AAA family ATPase [Roseiflexaceae bacterium]|nr:AAA family ATPase [Roseiflexaceae bacterium]
MPPLLTLLSQPLPTGADPQLRALLAWLHRLLSWQVDQTRRTFGPIADDPHRGLYVSDDEADTLLAPPEPFPELDRARAALAAERAELGAALTPDTPLGRLAQLFGLSPFECDVLLLALAPEIDLRYERIYGYIQDDVTKRRPGVDLTLRLLCTDQQAALAARAAFAPDAPLLRQRLLSLQDDGQRAPSLLMRSIKLDDRIVDELLGLPSIDTSLVPGAVVARPARRLDTIVLPDQLRSQLRRALTDPRGLVLALQGGYGSGRRAITEALCADAGLPLLSVALDQLVERSGDPADLARRATREARLRGAVILWQAADRVLHDHELRDWRAAVLGALDEHAGCSFLAIEQPWEARGALRTARYLRIELPELSFSGREQIWRQQLGAACPDSDTLETLASTFRLSGGQIRDAAAMARTLADWRNEGTSSLGRHDLYVACHAQSSGKLDALAHKIRTTYSWDDIVLPPDQLAMLREICVQMRHRRTVLEHWGFDRRLAMGKGINALVAGPSGTGKTMAAEIIAAELGLELYKVDLSTMVSKYIGETEKNLDKIFSAARESNAVLFFDEADAVFGKRSEVKDAHDRYANIEVGYLLQKMEEYDGVVILATNLRNNIDNAFIRRLHAAIDFPFPEEPDRLRIWQKVFPADAPLDSDIDLVFLARQFKLAGGNIRNVALLAAFLAAEDGASISMRHVVRATRREYQKLGKLITEADFGPYIALVGRPSGRG